MSRSPKQGSRCGRRSPARARIAARNTWSDRLAAIAAECEDKLGSKPAALAFGISGAVDPEKGVVMLPGKFANLEGYPLVPKLRRKLRIPVIAENDGRVSIIAEQHYGAARNRKWVVCLTIGTGVGSGVMLDGQILRDPFLQFGTQLGHIIMQADGGRLCITGAGGRRKRSAPQRRW